MIVKDNTSATEKIGNLFKEVGNASATAATKLATNVMKTSSSSLKVEAKKNVKRFPQIVSLALFLVSNFFNYSRCKKNFFSPGKRYKFGKLT